LRVELWQLIRGDSLLIVDLLVVIDGFSEHRLRFAELSLEVRLVGTSASRSEWLSIGELLDALGQVSDGEVHTFTVITSLDELSRAELPVRHGGEVLRVVSEHVRHLPVVEAAKVRVNLVALKGLLEVDGDLGSDLREDSRCHACITGFLEEEVLRLSQAKVAILRQSLLVEVNRVGISRKLRRHSQQLLKDPCGLAEVVAGHFDTITIELHEAGAAAQRHSEVVHAREGSQERRLRGDSLARERVVGDKCEIAGRRTGSENKILGEALHVLVVLQEEVREFLELRWVGLVLADRCELVVGRLGGEDVVLEVCPEPITVVEGNVRLAWLLKVDLVHAAEVG